MATSGIRRKVDDLGRVVIPASMRRGLNIREGDAVEVTVEGERVVIAKPRDACVFCGREEEGLRGFRGRLVCRDCLGSLGVLDERARAFDIAEREPEPAHVVTEPAVAQAAVPEPLSGPAPASEPSRRRPAPAAATADAGGTEDTTPQRTPWERARRPAALTGPIDGDAYARRAEEPPVVRRRPPQDPASTTAW
ncbi:AbrB/MazE/SpoVT family DNA-binding domain-containing protein [Egicoccus sp. AB-alg6-2]|uniref:AbrB/MazE/SpoVT family DNA-binding domain-containing protein n=1 Tax=Egicoccus sp. AB-alg6-2 TaxID=3242692 RepID=UPI00359E2694